MRLQCRPRTTATLLRDSPVAQVSPIIQRGRRLLQDVASKLHARDVDSKLYQVYTRLHAGHTGNLTSNELRTGLSGMGLVYRDSDFHAMMAVVRAASSCQMHTHGRMRHVMPYQLDWPCSRTYRCRWRWYATVGPQRTPGCFV